MNVSTSRNLDLSCKFSRTAAATSVDKNIVTSLALSSGAIDDAYSAYSAYFGYFSKILLPPWLHYQVQSIAEPFEIEQDSCYRSENKKSFLMWSVNKVLLKHFHGQSKSHSIKCSCAFPCLVHCQVRLGMVLSPEIYKSTQI